MYLYKEKDSNAKVKKIIDYFKAAKRNRADLEKDWFINYASYKKNNKIYMLNDVGSIIEINIEKLEKMNEMRTNRIFPIVRALNSQLMANRPMFSVDTSKYDKIPSFDLRVQEALANDKYEKMKDNVIREARIHYITTGNLVFKIFNNALKKYIVIDNKTEIIPETDIEIVVVPIFDFVADDTNNYLEKSAFTIQRILLQKSEAEKIFNRKFDTVKTMSGFYDYNTCEKVNGEYVAIYEYYEIAREDNENGYFIQCTEKEILDEGENPTPNGKLPYIFVKQLELGEFYSNSLISYLRPQLKEYNARRWQLNEHSKKIAKPLLILDKNAKIQEEKFGSERVSVVRANLRSAAPPAFLNPGEFSQYFFLNLSYLDNEIKDISGLHDVSFARPIGSRAPAMSYQFLKDQDDTMNSELIISFYDGIAKLLNLYLDFIRNKKDNKEIISYFGNRNYVYGEFIGKDLKEVEIKLTSMYGLSANRTIRQQQIDRMIAMGYIDKWTGLRLLEFGELEGVYGLQRYDIMRANKENQLIRENKIPAVDLYENHLIHIQEHINDLRSGDFFITPDMPTTEKNRLQKLREIFWAHIDMHWSAIGELLNKNKMIAGIILDLKNMPQDIVQLLMAQYQEEQQQALAQQQMAMQQASMGGGTAMDLIKQRILNEIAKQSVPSGGTQEGGGEEGATL